MTEYIDVVAAQIELPVRSEDRAAVEADFKRIAEVAKVFVNFPLDETIEAAPVFEP